MGASGDLRLRLSLYSTAASGGTWAHTFGLARALDRGRFDLELLTRPVASTDPIRAQLHAVGLAHVEVGDHEQLAAHLLRRTPDVVHHADSLMVLMALDLVNEALGPRRPKSVQLLHANGRPRIPLELADVVVGVSPSTLRWPGADQLGERARVIDSGVLQTPAVARARGGVPVILALTRLVEGKAVDEGLRALAELGGRAWSHRIVGEGPTRPALEALVARTLEPGRVHFTGALAQPRPELEGADIFLSCSASEGFGLALAEASEAGLAIVARRAGGLTEALRDGEHALLYDDPRELPGLLARLLDAPELRVRLGAAARAWVHARFDHAAMVQAYAALYLELAARTVAR